jgi:DNA polymerase III subunit beta
MKAIVNTSTLLKELKRVSPAISANTVIPIVSSVRMDFEKHKVSVRATDLETTIVSSCPCDCQKSFTIVVEFKDILDVCNKLNEPITIELKDKSILIIGDNYKSKLPVSGNIEEFPKIPEEEFLFSIDIDEDFISALYCADSCRSKEDLRTNMNTACLDFKKNELAVVGTDAAIMYKKVLGIKSGNAIQLLPSPKFVSAAKEMKTANLSVGVKFIRATNESVSIVSRLHDSKYVNYSSVIPEDVKYNLLANRSDLMLAIKKTAITSNKMTNTCVFSFTEGAVKISSQDIDFEKEGEYNMLLNHSVAIEAIGFNSKQMLDILNLFNGEEIQMGISSPTKSIYLSDPKDQTVFCLVQPLMLN